jgi:hypothetical protein
MFKSILGLEETQEIAGLNVYFNGGWIMAAVLIAAAAALLVYLYRSESRVTGARRGVMMVCQGLALLMLVTVLIEPMAQIQLVEPYRRTVLVLIDSSTSMLIEDPRTTPADVGEAAAVLGKRPLDHQVDDQNVDNVRQEIGPVSRFALTQAALSHADIDLANKLNEDYQVRFFSFGDQLRAEGGANDPVGWLKDHQVTGKTSPIGAAVEEAVARHAGQEIAGVVVISDFAWAKGRDPIQTARKLKIQGIPVYPVAVGLPKPPDVILRKVIAPEVVFKGDNVPIRVQIESHGFAGNTVELILEIDGESTVSQQIELENGLQFAELKFVPKRESGSVQLDVSVSTLTGETSEENNSTSHAVQIIDEKIKVLYIEGLPRWEYRYLRWVLLRDPRLEVTFLMTKGDPALAASSPRHLARFPQVAKDAFKYDLIILGDVPATFFNDTQMELMEDLVKSRAGSLLMVAGPMSAPGSYGETPIAEMLPVKLGNGQWDSLNVGPVVTAAGRESSVTTLSPSPETNDRIWANIRPMYLPRLDGAKPGATILLSTPKEAEQIRDYPLVAWQRYGTGKSMFVATEDLWRMRLEVGDRYHAKFWGQAIQFLTLSRLLGKNKQITIETDRRTYSAGEQVQVFANVLTQSFEPVIQESYSVILDVAGVSDSAAEMRLEPVPNSPGLYSGIHLAGEDGTYQLRTLPPDAEVSNRVDFVVKTVPLEDRETAAQVDVARQIAKQSGGESLRLAELGSLPEKLGSEEPLSKEVRMHIDLWDKPVLFVLFVLFAGVEWFFRRRENLV